MTWKNRMVMAPCTRCRADPVTRVPNVELMSQYYRERAAFGMILTEATSVNPMGVGYPGTPGIWSDEQVAAWKPIVQAVHEEGGTIVLQLWHVGRISHPMFLNGEQPVSSSATQAPGHVSLVRPKVEHGEARALTIEEIAETVEDYRKGAENAKKAGFDGVEVHGANGYLIEQFLFDAQNKRTDIYGGSLENRARFLLEVTDAVISVWGASRVGLHVSPRSDGPEIGDSDMKAVYTLVAQEMEQRKIAFIFARESWSADEEIPEIGPKVIKANFSGVFVANEKFDLESAERAIQEDKADAIGFGTLAIANADLVKRYQVGSTELNKPRYEFFMGFDLTNEGLNDYPLLATAEGH